MLRCLRGIVRVRVVMGRVHTRGPLVHTIRYSGSHFTYRYSVECGSGRNGLVGLWELWSDGVTLPPCLPHAHPLPCYMCHQAPKAPGTEVAKSPGTDPPSTTST